MKVLPIESACRRLRTTEDLNAIGKGRMKKNKIRYSLADVKEMVADDRVVLVDGGDAESFEVEHLPGAVNVPEIATYLADSSPGGLAAMQETFRKIFSGRGVSSDKPVIIYEDGGDIQCRSTCRGVLAAHLPRAPQSGDFRKRAGGLGKSRAAHGERQGLPGAG